MPISKETIRQYLRSQSVDLLLPVVIGLICGSEAVFIRTVIPLTFGRVMAVAGVAEELTVPIIFVFLLAGAYLTGLLAERMREASGVGLDVAIESYHSNAGRTTAKFAPLKFLATLFTLGSGGSGGLVGPAAVIGQGTASYFSKWFKLSQDRSKILALCGIAGCVSGLLHAPFGAAVFALELCYMVCLNNLICSELPFPIQHSHGPWITWHIPSSLRCSQPSWGYFSSELFWRAKGLVR
jgi:CIC family chloride channel protein